MNSSMSYAKTLDKPVVIRTKDDLFWIDGPYILGTLLRFVPYAKWTGDYWTLPASEACAKIIRDIFKDKDFQVKSDSAFRKILEDADIPKVLGLTPNPGARLTELWPHQRNVVDKALDKQGYLIAHDMGAGKTLSAITLMLERGHKNILVIAPKRVLTTWEKQLENHAGVAVRSLVLYKGSTKERAARLKNTRENYDFPLATIVNYEVFSKDNPLRRLIASLQWDLLVLDESHRIKAPGGSTSKWIGTFAKKVPYRIGLTGTPMPHSPLDIYAQYRAIEPKVFGTSFTLFKNRYALTHPTFKSMVLQWMNQEELNEKFYSIADRVETSDVVDLPERTIIPVYYELSDKERKAYVELEKEFMTWLDSGDAVTADNVLVKLLRLRQVVSGVLPREDGTLERIGNSRSNALADLLDDIAPHDPVVVFGFFHSDLDEIAECARKAGREYAELSGRVGTAGYERWGRGEVDLIGVQIDAGAEGINDLVKSRYSIFYAPTLSNGRFQQARARQLRPGQNQNVLEFRIMAEGTIDEKIYRTLDNNQSLVELIMRREDE